MAELQVHESSLSHASNFRKRRAYHETEITSLLTECDKVLNEVLDESHAGSDPLLHHARELCTRAGLSMESDLTTFLYRNQQQQQSLHHQSSFTTTAGHSNTDHRIIWTGDYASDRIAELKRSLFTRNRYQCPEEMGDSRWDKPRAPGNVGDGSKGEGSTGGTSSPTPHRIRYLLGTNDHQMETRSTG